jgi:hypothetical protein
MSDLLVKSTLLPLVSWMVTIVALFEENLPLRYRIFLVAVLCCSLCSSNLIIVSFLCYLLEPWLQRGPGGSLYEGICGQT